MQLVDIFLFRKGSSAVWCKAVSGAAVSQYRTQQPCSTQRTLDAAAGNVGMALRITLESMDLFKELEGRKPRVSEVLNYEKSFEDRF